MSQSERGTISVTRQFLTRGVVERENAAEEPLQVALFETTPAVVSVTMGVTMNLGNYESAKVDVRISLPCYKEEADQAYEHAHKWVEERLQREVREVRGRGKKG